MTHLYSREIPFRQSLMRTMFGVEVPRNLTGKMNRPLVFVVPRTSKSRSHFLGRRINRPVTPKYHSGEDLYDGPVPLESPITSDTSFSSASKAVLSSDFVDLNSSGPLKSPNTVRITSTNEAESSVDSQTSSMAVLRLPRPPALEMEQATTAHNALSDSHSENNQDISRYLQDFAGSIDMKFGPEHRYRICFFFSIFHILFQLLISIFLFFWKDLSVLTKNPHNAMGSCWLTW